MKQINVYKTIRRFSSIWRFTQFCAQSAAKLVHNTVLIFGTDRPCDRGKKGRERLKRLSGQEEFSGGSERLPQPLVLRGRLEPIVTRFVYCYILFRSRSALVEQTFPHRLTDLWE